MTTPSQSEKKCDVGTRNRTVRIDYMPSPRALAVIDSKRGPYFPLNTNRGVLDAIVMEWAALTGINKQQELPEDAERSARAQESGESGISTSIAGVRAGACESDARPAEDGNRSPVRAHANEIGASDGVSPPSARARMTSMGPQDRVQCGARRHRDGQPCQAKSEPGKRRCRFHGGRSTGPRTAEGLARSLANLRQFRAAPVSIDESVVESSAQLGDDRHIQRVKGPSDVP